MSRWLRLSLLTVVLLALVASIPGIGLATERALQDVRDRFDSRPERTVLFVGNSRTYYNDMPYMVRRIADSASAPHRYSIEMHALGGATLQDHLSDPEVLALLAKRWDTVVLQEQSGLQVDNAAAKNLVSVATQLISKAREAGSNVAMFITWRYFDEAYAALFPDQGREMHETIQRKHHELAAAIGVDLVNVGLVWERVRALKPSFSLYADDNHPSVHGSYLAALMFYAHVSGGDVENVTYRPSGVSIADAEVLRGAVSGYLGDMNGS